MKIRTVEDGQEIVYVEMSDIAMLQKLNQEIPISIYLRIADNDIITTDHFIENKLIDFEDSDDISFFNSFDWIVDYQSTIQLTEKQLEEIIDTIHEQIKKLNNHKISSFSKSSQSLLSIKQELLIYKETSLSKILNIKRGLIDSPVLPSDCKNFSMAETKIIPIENSSMKKIIKSFFQKSS